MMRVQPQKSQQRLMWKSAAVILRAWPTRDQSACWCGAFFFVRVLTVILTVALLAPTGSAVARSQPHPLDTLSADASPAEWMSEADGIIRARTATPGIQARSVRATPTELSIDFEVADPAGVNKIAIPLVIPRGEISTVTLSRATFDDRETTNPADLALIKVKMRELGYVRTFRIGVLELTFEPRALGGRLVTGGSATIQFLPAPPIRDLGAIKFWGRNRAGLFRHLVQRLVANPGDIDRYIVVPEQAIPRTIEACSPPPAEFQRSPFRLRIKVDREGIYRFTAADLESSGIVCSWLKPQHLRLFNNGREAPMHLLRPSGGDAPTLQPDDIFLFYGQENPSRFSKDNVYWLIYDEAQERKPMESVVQPTPPVCESAAGFMTRTTIEEDHKVLTRSDQFLSILGFRWVWRELPTSGTFVTEFDLPELMKGKSELPAVLNFFVHELPPETSVTICLRLNDGTVRRFPVTSLTDDRKPFTLAGSELKTAGNRLEVWVEAEAAPSVPLVGSSKKAEIYFDNLEVWYMRPYRVRSLPDVVESPYRQASETSRCMEYRIRWEAQAEPALTFDISDEEARLVPASLVEKGGTHILEFRAQERTPRRYFITTPRSAIPVSFEPVAPFSIDLRSTATQASYLMIAYPEFVEDVKPLAQRLEKKGHKVLVVDTTTVYDQFAHGQETPEAIKRFIDYAARYYDAPVGHPPASYVLLVGDATSAYKNEFRNNVINYVPSYTVEGDRSRGEQWASDHWYNCVFGVDDLADVIVGRISVNNRKDLQNVLAKLADYEQQVGKSDRWLAHIGFIADHTEFDSPTRRIADLVPPSYSVSRLSLSDEPWEDNFYFPAEIAEARQAKVSPEMTRKIRNLFNDGTALVWYFGHGSPNVWSTQRIWFGGDSENSDNLMLRNRDKLSIVLNMTCNSGAIDYPMPRWNVCISEDFLRVPNGGAVACYVPSGPGMVAVHELLSKEIVRSLLAERTEPLGAALTLAAYRYLAQGHPENLVRMYILLGDPAMTTGLRPEGGMFVRGLARAEDLQLASPVKRSTETTGGKTFVTLTFDVENVSELPVRQATFTFKSQGATLDSAEYSFFPRERRTISMSGEIPPGLWEGRLWVRVYGDKADTNLRPTHAVTVAGMGAETSDPLRIATTSMEIRHMASPPVASVDFDVANIGAGALSSLVAWLADANGHMLSESVTSASTVAPGAIQRLSVRRNYQSFPDREQLTLHVQGEAGYSTVTASCPLVLGKIAMPDLVIPEGGILPHKVPVVDGETVFFNVVVENRGEGLARNIRVEGYDGTTTGMPPLQSRVLKPLLPIDIAPRERAVIPVRWDPYRNAGLHEMLFRAWSATPDAEARLDNNQRMTRLKVLTKYRLKPLGVTLIPPTSEDMEKKQLRLSVKLANTGESPAHGVKVVVYADRQTRARKDILGELFFEEVPAGETVEQILVYKITSRDATRRLDPWCEAFLKGSLQRVPWPE